MNKIDDNGGSRDVRLEDGEEDDKWWTKGKPNAHPSEAVPPVEPNDSTSSSPSAVYLGPGSDLPALLNIGSFSPEMILQYVQTRLADIDGQMADIMGDANDKKAKSEELRKFQDAVRSLSGVGSKGPGFDASDANDAERATANADAITRLEKAKAELKDNPELVAKLQALENGLRHDDRFYLSAESIQNELDWAKDQLTSLNSMNELTMMRLNQLVQTRSQIISAASNAQASINEGMKNVIGNMRA
jgi:hypothetical protein